MSSINDIILSEGDLVRLGAEKASRDNANKDNNNRLVRILRAQRDYNLRNHTKKKSYMYSEYSAGCTLWDKPVLTGVLLSTMVIAYYPRYKVTNCTVYEVFPRNREVARSNAVLVSMVQNTLGIDRF